MAQQFILAWEFQASQKTTFMMAISQIVICHLEHSPVLSQLMILEECYESTTLHFSLHQQSQPLWRMQAIHFTHLLSHFTTQVHSHATQLAIVQSLTLLLEPLQV